MINLCVGSQVDSFWSQAGVPVWAVSYDVRPQDRSQVPRDEAAHQWQASAVSQVWKGVSRSLHVQGTVCHLRILFSFWIIEKKGTLRLQTSAKAVEAAFWYSSAYGYVLQIATHRLGRKLTAAFCQIYD